VGAGLYAEDLDRSCGEFFLFVAGIGGFTLRPVTLAVPN